MKSLIEKNKRRLKRKLKIRSKISGSSSIPRVSVFKSNKHFSAQVIDDAKGHTLCSVSTLEKELSCSKKVDDATKLGSELAKRIKEKGVSEVVFDRNGYKYHGVIKAFADGIRENGIKV